MKRLFFVVFSFVFLLSYSVFASMSNEEFLNKSPHVKKLLDASDGKANLESFKDIGVFYEVVIKTLDGKKIAYVTKDFNYLIIGSLFDKDGKNLTQQKVKEINKIDISKLPLNDALVHKAGNGSKKIIAFVDPFCPHCKTLINFLKSKTDYTLYMYLFPLNEKSAEVSLKIFCSDKPVDAYLNAANLEKTCEGADVKLDKHMYVVRHLNLRATPFVILEDGSNFYGVEKQTLEEFFKTVN